MHYDIATKVLMEKAGEAFLREFVGIEAERFELVADVPKESVSVKRADYVCKLKTSGGTVFVLVEFLSSWREEVIWNLLDYYVRIELKHHPVELIPVVFLLQPSSGARSGLITRHVDFRFELVELYEKDAREFLQECDEVGLLPLLPLMKGGDDEALLFRAERRIYDSPSSRGDKADMLTVMSIFAGFKSKDIVNNLISRRRDIMIESAAYEIIKKEGYREGIKKGIKEGIEKGIEKGGILALQESLASILEERFGSLSPSVVEGIKGIKTKETLKKLLRSSLHVGDTQEFEALLRESEK